MAIQQIAVGIGLADLGRVDDRAFQQSGVTGLRLAHLSVLGQRQPLLAATPFVVGSQLGRTQQMPLELFRIALLAVQSSQQEMGFGMVVVERQGPIEPRTRLFVAVRGQMRLGLLVADPDQPGPPKSGNHHQAENAQRGDEQTASQA